MNKSPLFQSLKLSDDLEIKNRVIMASLTRNRAVAGPEFEANSAAGTVPNNFMKEHYAQRARGGAGLILSEGALISPQGTRWGNAPGLWNSDQAMGWKCVVDGVHEEGSAMIAQLWHVGRVAHPNMPQQKGNPVLAPSAISARGGHFHDLGRDSHYEKPTEMTTAQVHQTLLDYRNAATLAKLAGFDGVELHAANGYLCAQFMDSTANVRTDNYGGSIENRTRFTLEALRCLIEVYGSKRVGIKLSPCGGINDVGMPEDETIATYGFLLNEIDKLDLMYVQLLQYKDFDDPEFDGVKRATKMNVMKWFRPLVKNSLFFLNGDLTPETSNELIQSGEIDAAVFGRLFINNPDLANRIAENKPLDTVKHDMKSWYAFSKGQPQEGYTDIVPEGGLISA